MRRVVDCEDGVRGYRVGVGIRARSQIGEAGGRVKDWD